MGRFGADCSKDEVARDKEAWALIRLFHPLRNSYDRQANHYPRVDVQSRTVVRLMWVLLLEHLVPAVEEMTLVFVSHLHFLHI